MSADKLLIHRSGPLRGTVTVNGAKNAVLPIMAACRPWPKVARLEVLPKKPTPQSWKGV